MDKPKDTQDNLNILQFFFFFFIRSATASLPIKPAIL